MDKILILGHGEDAKIKNKCIVGIGEAIRKNIFYEGK